MSVTDPDRRAGAASPSGNGFAEALEAARVTDSARPRPAAADTGNPFEAALAALKYNRRGERGELPADEQAAFDADAPRREAEREQMQRRWANDRYPEWCAHCEKPFGPRDTIYRVPAPRKDRPGWRWRPQPLCAACCSKQWLEVEPEPCATCGRPTVHHSRFTNQAQYDEEGYFVDYRPERRRWGGAEFPRCGDSCAEKHYRRDRLVTHDPRPCETCGETFTPKRADAQHCPRCRNAAKQKTYRARKKAVTDTGRAPRVPSKCGNGAPQYLMDETAP